MEYYDLLIARALPSEPLRRVLRFPSRGRVTRYQKETDLIIWDDVPMQHKLCFQVVDRLFRDLRGLDIRFGGIPNLLGR